MTQLASITLTNNLWLRSLAILAAVHKLLLDMEAFGETTTHQLPSENRRAADWVSAVVPHFS